MTQSELKELTNLGAELGAAKAEVERLREALRWYEEKVTECRKIGSLGDNARQALDRDGGFRARDALSQQTEPTDAFTAVDMATAAAQAFRDGQAAVEQAPAQDERKTFEAWAKTQGDKWLIVGGLQWSAGTDDYASARTNAAWAAWQERAALSARPAQTAPQGKFRMGDLVKKSTGSEWEGHICGTYSTELTPEGYAVESSAHRNSVQIYPAKALEAVE